MEQNVLEYFTNLGKIGINSTSSLGYDRVKHLALYAPPLPYLFAIHVLFTCARLRPYLR